MRDEEKKLVLELCRIKSYDKEKLTKALPKYASPAVLGHLFYNRINGVAYEILKNGQLLNLVNREFRNSLKNSYEQNIEKNISYFKALSYTAGALKECNGKYAMLKGAVLCSFYPEGCRTSNDIDLLIREKDVSEIGKVLTNHGFKQGYVKNDIFIPASRNEIIESKMMRGETVPYILEIDFPYMKYLEVDLNFSLDYKSGNDDIVNEMTACSEEVNIKNIKFMTLEQSDFFIHLCVHLYKEASTLPWIKMKRDMTLYKFGDIYMILDKKTLSDTKRMFERAKKLGLEKIVGCVILWTNALFHIRNTEALNNAYVVLKDNKEIMDLVFSPEDKKQLEYDEKNICNRFFSNNRESLLKVKKDG